MRETAAGTAKGNLPCIRNSAHLPFAGDNERTVHRHTRVHTRAYTHKKVSVSASDVQAIALPYRYAKRAAHLQKESG